MSTNDFLAYALGKGLVHRIGATISYAGDLISENSKNLKAVLFLAVIETMDRGKWGYTLENTKALLSVNGHVFKGENQDIHLALFEAFMKAEKKCGLPVLN